MKKTINYEKDIIFKTNIGEICSISLEHDFTVDAGALKGDFIVSGEYKTNELSVNKEPFSYRLPLLYELDKNADISTLYYDIENFEYNTNGDELNVYIDFGIRYEEVKPEIIIPSEEELDAPLEETKEEPTEEEKPAYEEIELPRLAGTDASLIMENAGEEDTYITYHVHIVREGDSLDSIALKYNSTIEMIKEYNDTTNLEIKSKLIVPEVVNE